MFSRRKPKAWSWFAPKGLSPTWEAVLAEAGGQRSDDPAAWDLWLPSSGKGLEQRLPQITPTGPLCVIGGLPGAQALSNKRLLWTRLVLALGRERAAELAPLSWLPDLPRDLGLLEADIEAGGGPYMLKDVRRQRREGVYLLADPLAALSDAPAERRPFLVQRCVDDVLAIDGHRCSLRVWVVVRRDGDRLTAWRHRDGLVVYAPGTDEWITRSTEEWLSPPGAPRRLSGLVKRLGREGRGVPSSIDAGLRAALASALGDFRKTGVLAEHQCFELFGVDFVLDGSLRAWLLEFNRKPSTKPREEAEVELRAEVLRDGAARGGVRALGKGRSYVEIGSWRVQR